jgi:mannose-6-phosphate isomerase-like protein (cupin superfamily)
MEVVLDDVADRARRFVEGAAALDAEVLRHRDVHALDVGTIPKGFHHRIRKAKEQHIVYSALPGRTFAS